MLRWEKKVSHSHKAVGTVGIKGLLYFGQMRGDSHSSPFATLSIPNLKKKNPKKHPFIAGLTESDFSRSDSKTQVLFYDLLAIFYAINERL